VNVDLSPSDDEFRQEVRVFFEADYPRAILDKIANGQTLTKSDLMMSERALQQRGWLAAGWPKEYGGPGWSVTQRFIFDEELERAGAPSVVAMGLIYLAPIVYTFGTEQQKQRWLPDILAGRTFWAQGYSEPEAGSDLASLRTSAVLDGDFYVVNGEKVWTTQAHYADWIFCLVRTSSGVKKQEGISFLCIDMTSAGVVVEPIITLDGLHHLNRVTFTDVRVPVDNRVGDEGRGWTYARHLLHYERTSYAHVAGKRRQLDALRTLSKGLPWGDLLQEPGSPMARRMTELDIDLLALEYTLFRALAPLVAGQAPGNESSLLKIMATEHAQAISELYLDLAGPYAAPLVRDRSQPDWRKAIGDDIPAFAPPAVALYFGTRAQTIYGGATEVQKNIVARQMGL
jgi:alkylation response protein AidB-like acyl-CoA dehydrogenase